MYPKIIPFKSPLDEKEPGCSKETLEFLRKVVDGTKFTMPAENTLVVEYPANLVKKVHLVNVDDSIVRIDFNYATDHFLHECFFPALPWKRENFFRNGRFNKCRMTFSEGKTVIEAPRLTAQSGTVSHGTLRNIDLFSAFLHLWWELDPDACRSFKNDNPSLLQALCDQECGITNDWWESEEASWTLDELTDALNDYAPDGYFFGTHPGDASDFGFWPFELLD